MMYCTVFEVPPGVLRYIAPPAQNHITHTPPLHQLAATPICLVTVSLVRCRDQSLVHLSRLPRFFHATVHSIMRQQQGSGIRKGITVCGAYGANVSTQYGDRYRIRCHVHGVQSTQVPCLSACRSSCHHSTVLLRGMPLRKYLLAARCEYLAPGTHKNTGYRCWYLGTLVLAYLAT